MYFLLSYYILKAEFVTEAWWIVVAGQIYLFCNWHYTSFQRRPGIPVCENNVIFCMTQDFGIKQFTKHPSSPHTLIWPHHSTKPSAAAVPHINNVYSTLSNVVYSSCVQWLLDNLISYSLFTSVPDLQKKSYAIVERMSDYCFNVL